MVWLVFARVAGLKVSALYLWHIEGTLESFHNQMENKFWLLNMFLACFNSAC